MSEVKQGDLYWCEPDPEDTVGSEQEGDRIWVIVSIPPLHRGNCVVELPLSRHTEKAVAHLIQVPKAEITMVDNNPAINRVALTDQIRALDKTRFRKKRTRVYHQPWPWLPIRHGAYSATRTPACSAIQRITFKLSHYPPASCLAS
jgi:mRNA-degrading endonuclease toxin of MazEF toxin-antitoxin module